MAVTFSQDGRKIATGAQFVGVIIREIATGEAVTFQEPIVDKFLRIAFSPEGTMVAFLCTGSINVWDTDQRVQLLSKNLGHLEYQMSVLFSPDGKVLAFLRYGGRPSEVVISLWDTDKWCEKAKLTFEGEMSPEFQGALAFSSDGKRLGSSCSPENIDIWNLETRSIEKRYQTCFRRPELISTTSLSWEDGLSMVVGAKDGSIQYWEASSGRVTRTRPLKYHGKGHRYDKPHVCLQSGLVAFVSRLTIQLCDTAMDEKDYEIKDNIFNVSLLGKDENVVFTTYTGRTGTMGLFDSGNPLTHGVEAVAGSYFHISSDRDLVALKTGSLVQFYDVGLATELSVFQGVRKVAFSPSGDFVALLMKGCDGVSIINTKTWEEKATLESKTDQLFRPIYEFSPGGGYFALGYDDYSGGKLYIWDLEAYCLCLDVPCYIRYGISFSPNDKWVIYTGKDEYGYPNETVLFELSTRRRKCTLADVGCSNRRTAFDSEGLRIAVCTDSHIAIWETSTGERQHLIKCPSLPQQLYAMKFVTEDTIATICVEVHPQYLNIQLWDCGALTEVGNLCIGYRNRIDGSISFDYQIFHSVQKTLELLPMVIPTEKEEGLDAPRRECLHAGGLWIYHGLSRLLWLPPAYRDQHRIAIASRKVALSPNFGPVACLEFDLDNAPTARVYERRCREMWDLSRKEFVT
jgi:WD40 repeat protein